jgi:predicted N-acyltransferase
VKNLHFEACYYAAIEYCIQNKITYFEPGAGGGEFKYLR